MTAGETTLGEVVVPLGVKAASNAAGAAAMALELGVEFSAAARALRDFAGVARRFERRGERDGVTFVDDYAHLPSEVAAAIETARLGPWHRVIAVFQPHRYTRTGKLWRDFYRLQMRRFPESYESTYRMFYQHPRLWKPFVNLETVLAQRKVMSWVSAFAPAAGTGRAGRPGCAG